MARPASVASSSSPPISPSSEKSTEELPSKLETEGLGSDKALEAGMGGVVPKLKSTGFVTKKSTVELSEPVTPVQENEVASSVHGVPIIFSRPDVGAIIRNAVDATAKDKRVLVTACGPDSMMTVVRNTTASCIRPRGPGVELHIEQFGW